MVQGEAVKKHTAGAVSVHASEGVEALADRVAERSTAAVNAVANAAAERALAAIKARWPVDTGRSRKGLTLRASSDGLVIGGRAAYTADVKARGETEFAWDAIAVPVALELAEDIAAAAAEALAEVIRGS
jgi:hypothetical protein